MKPFPTSLPLYVHGASDAVGGGGGGGGGLNLCNKLASCQYLLWNVV